MLDPEYQEIYTRQEKLKERRSSGACCCEPGKIEAGKKILIERFEEYRNNVRKHDPPGGEYGEDGSISCHGQNLGTMSALNKAGAGKQSGIPPCWECFYVRKGKRPTGVDHWWVECKAYDKNGQEVEHISFDAYYSQKGAGNPKVLHDQYPYNLNIRPCDAKNQPTHRKRDGTLID
jgi:hypothetical protein